MTEPSRLEIELAGAAMLVVVGVAAGFLDDVFAPGLGAPLVFLALMAIVLAAPAVLELDPAPAEAAEPARSSPVRTDEGADDDGGVLDVELVNWANPLVGETCLLCEEEVVYLPLGQAEGSGAHRIECGCTVIEATGKG